VKRREFVAAAVSAACVGAVGASSADGFESETVARPDRLDDAGSSGRELGESAGAASSSSDPAEPATLEVVSTASGETPVRFRLERVDDGTVVHDDVRPMTYGDRAYLSGLLDRGEAYAFSMVVDGAVLVQETVSPGERAVFELLDETTVSVVA